MELSQPSRHIGHFFQALLAAKPQCFDKYLECALATSEGGFVLLQQLGRFAAKAGKMQDCQVRRL